MKEYVDVGEERWVYRRSGNFHIKIICIKIFRVNKFSQFRLIREIFLTVTIWTSTWRVPSVWSTTR